MEGTSNVTPQSGGTFNAGNGEQGLGARNRKKEKLFQVVQKHIDEYLATIHSPQLLNEISYTAFQRTVSENTPKQQISKSFRHITKKINEIEQLLGHTQRFKESLGEGQWTLSEDNKQNLQERVKQLYREIKKL